jgi:hypothetical protein
MRKQRGVTMIGWIFLLIPMAIVGYAAIRVGPEYYEYYKLASAVQATADQLEGEEALTPQRIRGAMQARFDTGYIDDVKASELPVTKSAAGWEVSIAYETEVPLFGNIYLTLDFDKTVAITTN